MSKIEQIDVNRRVFDIHRDLSVSTRNAKPGPPERIDGHTVGVVTMEHSAPHGGEVHPDGDEILLLISGKVRVIGDSAPEHPLELLAGEACLIRAGEWHRVEVIERSQLVYITPGPNGDHRPQAK